MKIHGNDIRPNNIIKYKNHLCIVLKTQHTQPGKGGAYVQVELKDIQKGTKFTERFRSNESIERIRLDEKEYQFLYQADNELHLMDNDTYEQISVNSSIIETSVPFLKEGMNVTVCSYEGEIVNINLPDNVIMLIKEAEPVVKGQTAASSHKPAILENGIRIMVPPHIEAGTKVIISTIDGSYVGKSKE